MPRAETSVLYSSLSTSFDGLIQILIHDFQYHQYAHDPYMYISSSRSLPWTLDSYMQLSVPHLQIQHVQNQTLDLLPQTWPTHRLLITTDGNYLLPVAQARNLESSLTPVVLSHTHQIWHLASINTTFKIHPESNHFLPPLLPPSSWSHHHLLPGRFSPESTLALNTAATMISFECTWEAGCSGWCL